MNPAYAQFLAADPTDRRDVFIGAGQRLGTAPQNIEKDFWVCWTLDALFNGPASHGPRFLFKGGTSLSKGFGLIQRFSEDIDITVFREDIGQDASVEALEGMSGKKRQAKLDGIKAACQAFIGGDLFAQLSETLASAVGEGMAGAKVELDPDDESAQSLLLWYPSLTAESDGYIRKAVKIESGAKSALDPHARHSVVPYLADDLPAFDLTVANVTIVDAERTFWDKVVILHGLRRWFDARQVLRAGGQRVSRHYYDVHQLMIAGTGASAMANRALGRDCVAHARMFFNSRDLDLAHAEPGSFSMMPTDAMIADLRRDYGAMAGMIFGDVPDFDAVPGTIFLWLAGCRAFQATSTATPTHLPAGFGYPRHLQTGIVRPPDDFCRPPGAATITSRPLEYLWRPIAGFAPTASARLLQIIVFARFPSQQMIPSAWKTFYPSPAISFSPPDPACAPSLWVKRPSIRPPVSIVMRS